MITKHPIFTMLVGLPGSGKSTYAEALSGQTGAVVVSPDAIREELYGSAEIQGNKNKVFRLVHERIRKGLASGRDVILDATNVSSKKRKNMLLNIKEIECQKNCVVLVTPFEECLKNNANRKRTVSVGDMVRMLKSWETPYWFEGWDRIQLQGFCPSKSVSDWLQKYENYEQNTPWHIHTLSNHCISVLKYVESCVNEESALADALKYAAILHDNGKPECQSLDEDKNIYHFYKHENVGAYRVFEYMLPDHISPLDVSIMTNLHMRPRFFKDGGTKAKQDWGETLYDAVSVLNQGDEKTNNIVVTPKDFRNTIDWIAEGAKKYGISQNRSDGYDEKELF